MAYTDFTTYSHAQLRAMAQALNPGEVMAAGDPWRHAADTLKAIRATLTRASTEAAVTWEGTTSDAFHTRMLHLADSINNAASYANDAANTLHNMSEAIAKAKRDMPEEPSTWEKVKDTVGDGVSSVFGGDDEHIPVADRRKAEAATVMQTLAMHYRIATPTLKPPPPPGTPAKSPVRNEDRDAPTNSEPDGSAAAAGAAMAGAVVSGDRVASARGAGSAPQARKSVGKSTAPRSNVIRTVVPTDAGIRGGTAQVEPKPLLSGHHAVSGAASGEVLGSGVGPGIGTGIDATPTGTAPSAGGAPASSSFPVTPGDGPGVPKGPQGQVVGAGGYEIGREAAAKGVIGRENEMAGPAQRTGRPPSTGAVEGRLEAVGRAAPDGRFESSFPGRSGGVVGGGGRPGEREGGRQAFTEGGSGLGARNRVRGEPGSGTTGGMGPLVGMGDGRRSRSDKEKGGKRPDYLVEDAETWESDKQVNPNVVE
ncbi:hypothetical protein ACFVTF_16825 [Kitasatospora sp. NPDC057940]|uniref:WXG100-like domain-containing protein n=1 Tax=Kitasatospora sp. NPDC057940 TaxID=3346285 RepID=UPI0036DD47EB